MIAVAFVAFAAGCAGSDEEKPAPPPCPPKLASPVSERAFKRALSDHGIRVFRDGPCDREGTSFSNTAGAASYDDVATVQGDISCDLHVANVFGARLERFVWRNDREPTYLRVLNVDCSIYAVERAQTDGLERALRSLRGVSAAPSTVPSRDAVHD